MQHGQIRIGFSEKLGFESPAVVQIDAPGNFADIFNGHEKGGADGDGVLRGHHLPAHRHARRPVIPANKRHAGRAAGLGVDAVEVKLVAVGHQAVTNLQQAGIAGDVGSNFIGQGLFAVAHQNDQVVVVCGVALNKAVGAAFGWDREALLLQN